MSNIITNLENRDGIVSYAYATVDGFRPVKAEMQRGQAVDHLMTLREFLTLARADYEVRGERVALANDPTMLVPGVRVNRRTDTGAVFPGAVSRTYPQTSNRRKLAALLGATLDDRGEIIAERDDQRIASGGVLGAGEQCYALVPLHAPRKAGAAGTLVRYRFIHIGHDGTVSNTDRLVTQDGACTNQLGRMTSSRIERRTAKNCRSRAHVEARLTDIGRQMRDLLGQADEQDAAYDAMARTPLDDRQSIAALTLLYGKRDPERTDGRFTISQRGAEHVSDILEVLNSGDTFRGEPTGITRENAHTAWGVLAAATFHLDRVAPPVREVDEGSDAGEGYTGPVDEVLRRESTDSLVAYRNRLTDILTDAAHGANLLALVGAA